MNPILLIIDDEPNFINSIKRQFRKSSITDKLSIETAVGGREGLRLTQKLNPQIVLTDLKMPEIDGITILEFIKESDKHPYVIIMTGYSDVETALKLLKVGVYDYLPKPFNFNELEAVLSRIIREITTKKALSESEEMFRQLTENIDEVFYLLTPDIDRFIYISSAHEKIWGQSIEQLYLQPEIFFNMIHKDHRKHVEKSFRHSLEQGKSFRAEFKITRTDSSARWLLIKAFPVNDDDGHMYRAAATIANITQRKELEVELSRLREHEIKVGAEIQQAVLLSLPDETVNGMIYDALTIPSKHIDGDFYDFSFYNKNCLDILFGDVMGKGIPAALLAAGIKSSFLKSIVELMTEFPKKELPQPSDIVNRAHSHIAANLINLSSFVTLTYARVNLEDERFDFVDCGNTPIIYFSSRTKTCWRVKGTNFPIGFNSDEMYKQYSFPFEEDDLFFFYSDGITEAADKNGVLFGEERLTQLILSNSENNPSTLISNIKKAVVGFAQTDSLTDDLTCAVIKITDNTSSIKMIKIEQSFQADLNKLPLVREKLQESLTARLEGTLSPQEISMLILAVHEAATNIIKYAFNSKEDNRLQLEIGIHKRWLFIQLFYKGELFNWTTSSKPILDGTSTDGFGIHMISQIMDSILYTSDNSGMCSICMIKNY